MWSKSNIETKIEMQRLVFPDGIYLNHENKQYRTNVVNEVIVLSGLQCNKNGGKQNDSVAIKTTESDSVPGAGIEPARP